MSRRIPRLTGARPTNEQTRLMNSRLTSHTLRVGSIDFIQECLCHCAHIPAFILHQVTCQFATDRPVWSAQRLAGTVLCGTVGRNGVGKTRLLRLLAGLDSPAGGHVERAAAILGSAAADARRRPPSLRCWARVGFCRLVSPGTGPRAGRRFRSVRWSLGSTTVAWFGVP